MRPADDPPGRGVPGGSSDPAIPGDEAGAADRPAGPAPDLGLFGPDTVTWRVHADPSMRPAALRALFLQTTHPLVAAALPAHLGLTAGATDPGAVARHVTEHLETVTFAPRDEAARAGERVRRAHRRIGGRDPVDGRPYRLDRPDLLAWVHSCEVESCLTTARRAGLRLRRDDADDYVGEQARRARMVGLDPALVPTSVAELQGYLQDMRRELSVDLATRRDLARTWLLRPPGRASTGSPGRSLVGPRTALPALAALPGWAALAGLAFALLPRWARRLYGAPGLPSTDVAATAVLQTWRLTVLTLPTGRWVPPAALDAYRRARTSPRPSIRRLDVFG